MKMEKNENTFFFFNLSDLSYVHMYGGYGCDGRGEADNEKMPGIKKYKLNSNKFHKYTI